jgi:hypothetical protein
MAKAIIIYSAQDIRDKARSVIAAALDAENVSEHSVMSPRLQLALEILRLNMQMRDGREC